MESLQSIKRRIKGIENINQITKAMELVAATKMRRSQEVALNSRPYAYSALDLLISLTRLDLPELPPILQSRPVKNRLFVVVTSDKGLAGAFNSSVLREFEKFLKNEGIDPHAPNNHFITVGLKAAAYLERRSSRIVGRFVRVGDFTTLEQVLPVAKTLIDGYLTGKWDEVTVFSTHFRSALTQDILKRVILPVKFDNLLSTSREIIPETGRFSDMRREVPTGSLQPLDYLIEPSPAEVMEALASHLVTMQVYHLILEANASEHAARRVAMKSASDNAEELAGKLTVEYNKSRQAVITREIIEITAGAESIQK